MQIERQTYKAAYDLIEHLAVNCGDPDSQLITAILNILRDVNHSVFVTDNDDKPIAENEITKNVVEINDCNNNIVRVGSLCDLSDFWNTELDLTVFEDSNSLLDDIEKSFLLSSNGSKNVSIIVQESFPEIGKFIHLYNKSENAVNIGGCVLKRISGNDIKSYGFDDEFMIRPKSSIMLWPQGARPFEVDDIFLDHEWSIGSTTKIQLLTPNDVELYSAETCHSLSNDESDPNR